MFRKNLFRLEFFRYREFRVFKKIGLDWDSILCWGFTGVIGSGGGFVSFMEVFSFLRIESMVVDREKFFSFRKRGSGGRAGAGVRYSAVWSCWRVLWMRTCLRRLGVRGFRFRWILFREMRSRVCW